MSTMRSRPWRVVHICCFQIRNVSFRVIRVEKWCKEGDTIGEEGGEKIEEEDDEERVTKGVLGKR